MFLLLCEFLFITVVTDTSAWPKKIQQWLRHFLLTVVKAFV